jgi:hypothetical protein
MFETLGRKQAQIEAQDAAYNAVLSVLDMVVKGEVTIDRVKVDMATRSWAVAPKVIIEDPEAPAQE